MLVGIEEHRAAVARIVRREREEHVLFYGFPFLGDVDVSLYAGEDGEAANMDRKEHRRAASEAKAELWRNIRSSGIADDELEAGEWCQTYEEMEHTE